MISFSVVNSGANLAVLMDVLVLETSWSGPRTCRMSRVSEVQSSYEVRSTFVGLVMRRISAMEFGLMINSFPLTQ